LSTGSDSPGQRRFVHVAVARHDHAVERQLFAGLDQDVVSDANALDGDSLLASVRNDQRLAWREVDQGPDGLARALERPHLEPLRDGKEEHDAGLPQPSRPARAPRNRDHHQDVDVECADFDRRPGAARRKNASKDRCGNERCRRHSRACGSGECEARRQQHRAGQHQAPPPRRVAARALRLLVLEPHAHPGLPDRIHHGGRCQLGGVVLDVKALADQVGRQRFEAREWLEPPLEDDDLLVAVHSLDAEDGLGVKLTGGADGWLGGSHGDPSVAGADHLPQSNV
jgi:hypothetical protein